MNLQQLKAVREMARQGLNLTRAAKALRMSQPSMSRHVREAELMLGIDLFVRERNRFVGLTPEGTVLLPIVARALETFDEVGKVAARLAAGEPGSLRIATSHIHARYALPSVIEAFIERYPRVELQLRQGYLPQIVEWVRNGEADLSISAKPEQDIATMVFLPWLELHRIVVTKPDHPLLRRGSVTLDDLAALSDHNLRAGIRRSRQPYEVFREGGPYSQRRPERIRCRRHEGLRPLRSRHRHHVRHGIRCESRSRLASAQRPALVPVQLCLHRD